MTGTKPRHSLKFRAWRQYAGKTQRAVAVALDVGANTVSYWDAGRSPNIEYLPAIAELFGCTIDQLFQDPPA